MTATGIWQEIGAGENIFTRLLRLLFLLAAAAVFYFPCGSAAHLAAAGGLRTADACCMALALARSSDSYLITLTLMIMSMFCTFRYGYWRINQVIRFFQDPANHWGALDAFFIICLLLAEVYAFIILFLGYFQTIWPLRRAPVALPDDPEEWPHIDVLIPTYNEPLDVVRYTALGALNMDWPADKLHVYILDDGRRKEFEQFAFEAGIGYRTRPDNKHAKAGNINTALKTMNSPFVAIFDSDHVPTRSFLQMTMGWFLRDPKLAMLQTPHHFYSPDPFERNLRAVPHHSQRRRAVLRHRPGRQRLLECDLLLRLLRGAAARGAGRDRRHRRRDRHRRCAHLAAHADERLEHGLHQHSPGRRPGHRAALRARGAAHSLGARHDPDPAHRQSALRARPEVSRSGCATSTPWGIFSTRCRASSSSPRR